MLLGQIVAISFAMNLSFLAILLSDPNAFESATSFKTTADGTTMAEKTIAMTESESFTKQNGNQGRDEKPGGHSNLAQKAQLKPSTPTFMDRVPSSLNKASYIGSLFLTFISVLLIPSSVYTRFFLYLLAVPHVVLFLPVVLPSAWKQTKPHTITVNWASMPAYRLVAEFSLVLYVKATIAALTDGQPGGLERFLRELYSHPAVSSVGWDVILCCLSAFVWISVHGPDSWMILRDILPFSRQRSEPRLAAKASSKSE